MTVRVKCVHCGTMVHEFTAECPNCHKPVANRDAPVNVTRSPWKMKNTNHGKKSPVLPIAAALVAVVIVVVLFIIKK